MIVGTPSAPDLKSMPAANPASRYTQAETKATTIEPISCPASNAVRFIGVIASRLMKPVSTSRASELPALIAANSEPWMNGTAIAKSQ